VAAGPEGVVFETERLLLRRFRPADWRELQAYVSRPEVTRYDFEYPSTDPGCRELAAHFAAQEGIWAVCLKRGGNLIGHVVSNRQSPPEFLTWDIGFIFNPDFESQGYAAESCARIIDHNFEILGAHRIESHCHPDNARSRRLLERLGMRREGHHLKSVFLRRTPDRTPIWVDSLDYALLRDEWRERRPPRNQP
jgi:RimJ/RimL family protein N-acetyltransferase